jgi:hypothetical protein
VKNFCFRQFLVVVATIEIIIGNLCWVKVFTGNVEPTGNSGNYIA